MRTGAQVAIHVGLPLLVGGLVYVARAGHATRSLVVGSAPDAAWAWAFGAAIVLVWRGRPGRARSVWLAAGLGLAAWAEIGQRWGFPPGTFDPADLVAILAGYALGAALAARATRHSRSPDR